MQQPAPDENQPQLTAEDRLLLASLARGGEWLRALLCTLARRGVALRTASPARARALLDALAPLPLYKGGQFLFDLLEWEDFMLDGPEPPILPTTLDGRALAQIAAQLAAIRAALDGAEGGAALRPSAAPDPAPPEDLPKLEAGFYLYQDVVLGVMQSVERSLPAQQAPPEP
jgi:hypothetical protein